MSDTEKTIEALQRDLAAANARANEFERLYKSTVTFQGHAHDKKVRAKRDRDEVIAMNVRLQEQNGELRAKITRLEANMELYA